VLVAAQHQLRAQLFDVQVLPLAEEEGVAGHVLRRREAVQRGAGRHDHHVDAGVRLAQPVQRLQPLRHQVLVRRQRIVGQRFPVGQRTHRQRRGEVGDLVDQALRVQRIGRDDDQQAVLRAGGGRALREQQCVRRARRAREGDTGPCDRQRSRLWSRNDRRGRCDRNFG